METFKIDASSKEEDALCRTNTRRGSGVCVDVFSQKMSWKPQGAARVRADTHSGRVQLPDVAGKITFKAGCLVVSE